MWKKPDCVDRSLPLSIPVPVSDCGGEFKPPSGGSSSLSPLALPSPFHLTPVTLSRSVSLSVARSLPRADGRQVSKHCRQACVTKQITHTHVHLKKKNKTQHGRGACGQLRIRPICRLHSHWKAFPRDFFGILAAANFD